VATTFEGSSDWAAERAARQTWNKKFHSKLMPDTVPDEHLQFAKGGSQAKGGAK